MKRRLSLAISLVGNPKLLILDEPTTGMDPKSKRFAWNLIQEEKKHRAVVLTTHDMYEADVLNDRIAIMKKGEIVADGSSLELKN
jgi:ABC-type multidrug transport system ATPase subunit